MSDNIEYRLATQSDIPQLVALMNSQYTRKKTEAYFLWQFFDSRYPTVLMCAVEGDIVVGMFGMQKRATESGAIAGQAIDLLLKPDYRGRGIFKEMGQNAVDALPGLDILCVLPNQNGKNACQKAFGWKVLGKIDSLELYTPAKDTRQADVLAFCNDGALEQFHYDENIYDWRFGGNPDYSYQYVWTGEESFAITKLFEDPVSGKRYGDIVNFSCNRNDPDIDLKLFTTTAKTLMQRKVESVTTWALPHTKLYKVLTCLGFLPRPQERYFCVEVLNRDYIHLYEMKNWHLVQSDAEFY